MDAARGHSAAPRVDLPRFEPGGQDRAGIVAALDTWVRSDAMRRLATASGWPWPGDGISLDAALDQLVDLSEDWDFRRGAERHRLTTIPAVVRGKELNEGLIAAAAGELGLAGRLTVDGSFSHVVVLGGMVRACWRRSTEAANRVEAMGARGVAVLSAHRPLQGQELRDADELGWAGIILESEAAAAAARACFGLAERPDREDEDLWDGDPGEIPEGTDAEEYRRRRSWAYLRWETARGPTVDVVAAPSGDPGVRRTNTGDQLTWWAGRAGIAATDDLLLVTTDHYVPAQHFDAVRTLGLAFGCGVQTCGVEWVVTGDTRGAAYLQEVRSGLLAARRLLDAAT